MSLYVAPGKCGHNIAGEVRCGQAQLQCSANSDPSYSSDYIAQTTDMLVMLSEFR